MNATVAQLPTSITKVPGRGHGPHPIDVHVGSRVRLLRVALGISQEKLASLEGISCQQIQKYEKAASRMSASRLFSMSKTLGVPISFFFDDLAERVVERTPAREPTRMELEIAKALVKMNADQRMAVCDICKAITGQMAAE